MSREKIMARAEDKAVWAYNLTKHSDNKYALQDERSTVARFEKLKQRELDRAEAIREVEGHFEMALQQCLLEVIPFGTIVNDGASELERIVQLGMLEREDHEGGWLFYYAGKPVLWAGPLRTRVDPETGHYKVARTVRRL